MLTVIGHEAVRKLLEDNLPQVVSLIGPKSIGKRTLAIYLAQFHGFEWVDVMEWEAPLTGGKARQVQDFARTHPFERRKLAIVHLDSASDSALNDMLKLLEEPPSYMHFILISTSATLPTIMSRSQVFHMGTLSPEELTSVLTRFNGMNEGAASKVSFAGQVSAAKEAYEGVNAKAAAVATLKAVESRDILLFKRSFKAVDDLAARMIERALQEAATGDWQLFSPSDLPLFSKRPDVALRLLEAWSQTGSARRSLSARVVLEPVVRRN